MRTGLPLGCADAGKAFKNSLVVNASLLAFRKIFKPLTTKPHRTECPIQANAMGEGFTLHGKGRSA